MAEKDLISKTLLKRLVLDMGAHLFGLNLVDVEILETDQQRIEERQADLVVLTRESAGTPFILHIEIQNDNDSTMPLRMMRYFTDIALAYPDRDIQQYLLYIGKASLSMPAGVKRPNCDYHYQLIDAHHLDCEPGQDHINFT